MCHYRWGIGVMLGILVSGGVSGGHLNPAITVAVASVGKFPWRKVSQGPFKNLSSEDVL